MIIGFTGAMGSGKTLSMTYYAYKYYKSGSTIFANYGLLFPHKDIDYEKIKALDVEFQNSVLCLDEIHVFIDSRSSMSKVNKVVSYLITQSRKRNIILMYSTQHIGQVDLRLRSNTDYFISCKQIEQHRKLYIVQSLVTWSGAHNKMYLDASKVFKLYDTHEIVNPFHDDDGKKSKK
jgi:DNA replication protein DnaC